MPNLGISIGSVKYKREEGEGGREGLVIKIRAVYVSVETFNLYLKCVDHIQTILKENESLCIHCIDHWDNGWDGWVGKILNKIRGQ